ncbi:MAG TPA: metal-dependent transcriptional regulator [bacterium]|nr:metal-dependent transcriptional regulator [bacterium]
MTTHDIAKVERTEMYLKSVLTIAQAGHRVTTSRVAEAMGVSAPSASEMLKRLEHLGYLEGSAEGTRLTTTGLGIATQVVRRLRLAERLLTDVLKMDLQDVYDEACKMEHVISPQVEARLDDVLGHPATCPHGHPIPARDGVLPPRRDRTLATLAPHTPGRVTALPEERTDLLKVSLATGLRLGVEVSVEASATPRGPLIVRTDGIRRTVARDAAAQVWVVPASGTEA